MSVALECTRYGKEEMLCVLVAGIVGWAEGEVVTLGLTAGVVDFVSFSVGSAAIMDSLPSANAAQMAEFASSQCDRARWMEHKAEQMFALAAELNRDELTLDANTKQMLGELKKNNDALAALRDSMKRRYPVELLISAMTCVGVVIIVVWLAIVKGRGVRAKLDALRAIETQAAQG